jgi:hypothetical protein
LALSAAGARPQRRQPRRQHRRRAPRYQRRDRRADGHVFLPLPVCREHVPRTATVAPLLDVAQMLIDDLGSDVQRLQLFDAFACLFKTVQPGGVDQARLLRRIVVRADAQRLVAARARADHRLHRGAVACCGSSRTATSTRVCRCSTRCLAFAHRHARQRNALSLLESGMQLLFFTCRRDNNAPLSVRLCCCPTRCSGAR